jgi:hypothetical protein
MNFALRSVAARALKTGTVTDEKAEAIRPTRSRV